MQQVELTPDDHQAYQRAVAAFRQGDYAACAELASALVQSHPTLAESHQLIGLCHYQLDRLNEAEAAIRKAISLRETAEFYQNLALVLQKPLLNGSTAPDSQTEEAITAFRRAIELDPSFTRAKETLAGLLARTNRPQEAFPLYRDAGAWVRLQFEMRKIAEWDGLEEIDRLCLAELEKGASTQAPWNVMHLSGVTPAMQKQLGLRHVEAHIPQIHKAQRSRPARIETTGRKLRIGYLSSDFFNHATMHLIAGVLEKHDREAFEIVLISYTPRQDDDFTRRIGESGLPLVDIFDKSDADAALVIEQQNLDILVDLKGHTFNARSGITALRPAPIIVNWLGFPGTLGHPGLADYIIGDPVVTPPEHAGDFSERLALMPHSYQPNDASRPLPPSCTRKEAGLPQKGFVFCSFNQVLKLNPQTCDLWARLIVAVPGSVLWLLKPSTRLACDNICSEFAKRGVSEDRIVFAPFLSVWKNTARLRLADLALDTFPHNSHTTASDALWAGVPLVTQMGQTFASRVAASLLTAHGFAELITANARDYFDLAIKIATDAPYRQALKTRLDDARRSSPLFDTQRFTADLEALFRAMIDDHNTQRDRRPPCVQAAGNPLPQISGHSMQDALDAYSRADYAVAAKMLVELLQHQPRNAAAHHLLGVCHYQQSRFEDAEREIRTALSIEQTGEFYRNLGAILALTGKNDPAIEAYENAVRLAWKDEQAQSSLTRLYFMQRRYEKATGHFQNMIEREPDNPRWHKGLGSALMNMNRLREAEPPLRRALELDPSMEAAKHSLALLLPLLGRQAEAVPLLAALEKWLQLQFALRELVQWDELAEVDRKSLAMLARDDIELIPPLTILYMQGVTPSMQKLAARKFAISQIPELSMQPLCSTPSSYRANRPLRIGYLSADFHDHATMHLLAGVFDRHDRTNHEISIFSYGRPRDDSFSSRLHKSGYPIFDLSGTGDHAAAKIIAEQHLDILVELKGYTFNSRLGITALRPAPVIINWLGFPGTLGHERLADYIIGDPVITPPEHAGFFSERLALMPDCYQPNDSARPLGPAPSRAEAGLPEDGFVFSSFNQAVKYNPPTFDIWARLLKSVPSSVLWLINVRPETANDNIVREFGKRGISPERIIIAAHAPQADHIARLRLADLALDTFPCTSHTTASDALWAGVPLVTLVGNSLSGRVAASLLTAHGFPELVTRTEQDYFDLALKIAVDGDTLRNLKQRLERSRHTSPLFDTQRFTRNLESLFRAILKDHITQPDKRPPVVTIGQSGGIMR